MKRIAMEQLCIWKEKKNRKPLIIRGARQVGKTWLMKEFGKQHFKNVVYISFDNNERMKHVFELDYDINRIMEALSIESGQVIKSENTLLIFDEIQEVPKALTCLKYFQENVSEYAIVAAGSLLGVALHEGTSFPVGKVDFLNLYPLSFKEFLMACGEEQMALLLEKNDYELANVFGEKYKELLKKYYYIGGMPEAVSTYLETGDYIAVREVQNALLSYYSNDFSKHAPKKTVPRIQMVWNSIPMQLTKENKKFIYGVLREGARAKEFELAIQWLLDCGLIHKSYRVTKPALPLIGYMEMSIFKVYFLDVGLLAARCQLDARTLLEKNTVFTEFKGALTEQYIAQELVASGRTPYYFSTKNSSGEIDFIIQEKNHIVPIEVKAEENLQAKSLKAYCQKYKPEFAVRTSMAAYKKQDWLTNVPLYGIVDFLKKV